MTENYVHFEEIPLLRLITSLLRLITSFQWIMKISIVDNVLKTNLLASSEIQYYADLHAIKHQGWHSIKERYPLRAEKRFHTMIRLDFRTRRLQKMHKITQQLSWAVTCDETSTHVSRTFIYSIYRLRKINLNSIYSCHTSRVWKQTASSVARTMCAFVVYCVRPIITLFVKYFRKIQFENSNKSEEKQRWVERSLSKGVCLNSF